MIDRSTYCKDCKRSIWGEYHDCDNNIADNGYFNLAGEKCYCKVLPDGNRAEKYPWELEGKDGCD